jgi:hypothetical protein
MSIGTPKDPRLRRLVEEATGAATAATAGAK